MTRTPDFVILGTQKSASTFVQACLSEHPDLYLPPDEIPYFETPDYESGAAAGLTALFEGQNARLVGFKRPNSLGKPEVPARLATHLPNARFIVVLRDPVSRSISAYYHYMKYGFIPVLHVEAGMRRILGGDYDVEHPAAKDILEYGFYHRHLCRYLEHFTLDRFTIVLHEDIVQDKVAQIQSLYRCLGVDDGYTPKALSSRPQAVVYSLPRLRFLTRRNRF